MLKLFVDRTNSPKLNSKDYSSQIHFVVTTQSEINKANLATNTKKRATTTPSQQYSFGYFLDNFAINQKLSKANFKGTLGQSYTFESIAVNNSVVNNTSVVDSHIFNNPTVFVGFNSKEDTYSEIESIRRLSSIIFSTAKKYSASNITISLGELSLKKTERFSAFIEGFELTDYSFDRYLTKNKNSQDPSYKDQAGKDQGDKNYSATSLTFFTKEQLPISEYEKTHNLVVAIKLARDLINTPANDCTPSYLVKVSRDVARESKLGIKVYDKDDLKKMGANLLLSVAAGSDEPPYLINLTYKPKKPSNKIIALVGKGVTFDTGGISIKPAAGMEAMKGDMAGAAAVIAAMQVIGKLQPNVEVRAYIPTTENMINGSASRPGDVVRAINGKTVEILNTDAEGRMILADSVILAEKEGATTIIDIATLTGACVVALGNHYAGIFTDNDKLCEQLINAGERSAERFWRLPLIEEHKEYMKSKVADIKHIAPPSKGAGATNGALFIKYFIDKAQSAHLDIAGTGSSDNDKFYIKAGGVGFGVGTLVRYVAKN